MIWTFWHFVGLSYARSSISRSVIVLSFQTEVMRKIMKAHLVPIFAQALCLQTCKPSRCRFANSFYSISFKNVQFSRDTGDEFNFLNTAVLNHDTRQLINIYVGSFLSYLDEWWSRVETSYLHYVPFYLNMRVYFKKKVSCCFWIGNWNKKKAIATPLIPLSLSLCQMFFWSGYLAF